MLDQLVDTLPAPTEPTAEPTPNLLVQALHDASPATVVEFGFGNSTKLILDNSDAKVFSFDWHPDAELLTELTFRYDRLKVLVNDHKRIAGYDAVLPLLIDFVYVDGGDSFDITASAVQFLFNRFHAKTVLVVHNAVNERLVHWLVAAGWAVTGQDDTHTVLSKPYAASQ